MSETILDNLLKEIKEDDLDSQVKQICDKIQEEEDPYEDTDGNKPDFPTIFLSLTVKPTKNEYLFLTLEREIPSRFIVGLWSKNKYNKKPTKRINSWEVREVKANKIIKEFAKIYKTYK